MLVEVSGAIKRYERIPGLALRASDIYYDREAAMSQRLLLTGIVCLALCPRASADSLDAQLFPFTGEIRFHNPNAFAVPFVYSSITSLSAHSGALNPAQWRSISDFYDASGNGFIDPTGNWTKIATASTELTEGLFPGQGSTFGRLPAFSSVSFGTIWNPGVVASSDIGFDVRQDAQPVTMNIQLAIAGDYDHSHTVDLADYAVWRMNFGSNSALDADGNVDGVVNAADYTVWRKNFGASIQGAGSSQELSFGESLVFGGQVPEPAAGVLASMGVFVLTSRGLRRVA